MDKVMSECAIYDLFENYVVATYFEGADPGLEEAVFIYQLISQRYKNNFGWVSNRVNSYSSHQIFIKSLLEDFTNFKCIAWVTYHNDLKKRISPIPGFIPCRIKSHQFDSLEEAKDWVQETVKSSGS